MQLDTFVTEALLQIIKGVRAAQEQNSDMPGTIVPHVKDIYGATGGNVYSDDGLLSSIVFDVAIVTSTNSQAEGKVGIFVAGVGIGGGGGSSKQMETSSRIQFTVPIVLPASRP